MYRTITHCRACQSASLEPVVDFGIQPLANDFKKEGERKCGHYPLKVMYCRNCTLAQLSDVVDPHVLYDHYSYVTSTSDTMRAHFGKIVNDMCQLRGGAHLGDLLEIGSNNGEFLTFSRNFCSSQIGVDPAANLCREASTNRFGIINDLWGKKAAAATNGVKFDTVVARHVFAHCDDWVDFMECISMVTHPKSLVFIEVPYARNLIERCEFDTIYHEHLSYVTLRSIHALLFGTRFKLDRVIHYPIHGGSVGLVIRQRSSGELHSELGDCETDNIPKQAWKSLEHRALEKVGLLVDEVSGSEDVVIGYGAPAKTAIWCNLAETGLRRMVAVHDTTPQKHGTTIPGTSIPVTNMPPSLNSHIKTAIMWCWNFAEEVRRKEKPFLDRGGKFILPLGK